MDLAMPPHLGKVRHPPAPRSDASPIQAAQVPEQVVIDLRERRDDLVGLVRQVPLERSDAAALKIDPAQTVSSQDPVAVVGFAVETVQIGIVPVVSYRATRKVGVSLLATRRLTILCGVAGPAKH